MEKLEQQFSENLLITSTSETQPPKSVREHYSDPIPVDLLVEIFSRVPADSIARFRCVSKFWGYILGRPDFTELFLTKSSTRPRLLFTLTADDGKLLFYSSPQPQNPDDNSTVVATRYHTSSYTYFPSWYSNKILGLVLLHKTYNRKVRLICNPVTGDFLTLPKLLVEDKTITGVEARAKAINGGIHLGYDPIRKQFKVLRMNLSCGERPNTHHVLTLEYGKRLWRSIGCKYHFIENGRKFGEVCINGVLYFGAVLGRYWVIVCFDVRSEKFGFIKIDKLGQYNVYDYLELFNYKGKLGLRTYGGGQLLFWVLEDAENHKWSKHIYELPPLIRGELPPLIRGKLFGMTATGEILKIASSTESQLRIEI